MNILNYGAEYLRRFYGWEAPSSNQTESSFSAIRQPSLLDPKKSALDRLIDAQIIYDLIINNLTPQDALEAFESFSKSVPRIRKFLAGTKSMGVWKSFSEKIQSHCKTVINLDRPDVRHLLGLSSETPKSLESIRSSCYIFAQAESIAKHSENNTAIILTIPADWSVDKLERMMGTVKIEAGNNLRGQLDCSSEHKTVLQNNPIKKEQTIVLSNTVIKGSRSLSAQEGKKLLGSLGLGKEFPDPLIVLTVTFLANRILATNPESYAPNPKTGAVSFTFTNKKAIDGRILCVVEGWVQGQDPASSEGSTGIGAFLKFEKQEESGMKIVSTLWSSWMDFLKSFSRTD